MSHIKNSLLTDETILFAAKPHPVIFLPAILLLLASLFVLGTTSIHYYSILVFFIAIILTLHAGITYVVTEYAITNKRIVMKTGWLTTKQLEIFLDRIESVNVRQNILGQILNFGTLTITGIGGTSDAFYYIPQPLQFRNKVQEVLPKK